MATRDVVDYDRRMTELTIAMPNALQEWVDLRLSEGEFADAADYLRALVRRDRADREWLKAEIMKGIASGVCEDDAFTVLDQIMAEDLDARG